MVFRRTSLLLGLVLLTSACGSITDPSKNLNETFSGTLPFGGTSEIHNFSVSRRGEYSITINSLTPATGSLVGVRFGLQSAGDCAFITSSAGQLGKPALNGPIDAGGYCMQLYDLGTLPQSETYTLTISHP
jgi:hypothetical protein